MLVATMLPTSTLGSGSGPVAMAWAGAAAGTAARAMVLRHTPALQTAAPQTAATQPPLQLPRKNVPRGADIARSVFPLISRLSAMCGSSLLNPAKSCPPAEPCLVPAGVLGAGSRVDAGSAHPLPDLTRTGHQELVSSRTERRQYSVLVLESSTYITNQ